MMGKLPKISEQHLLRTVLVKFERLFILNGLHRKTLKVKLNGDINFSLYYMSVDTSLSILK